MMCQMDGQRKTQSIIGFIVCGLTFYEDATMRASISGQREEHIQIAEYVMNG